MKKNNILPQKATTVLSLPECFIREEGTISHLKEAIRTPNLPRVGGEYEDVLLEVNALYRLVDGQLEYWSPVCHEAETKTLPLYEKVDGIYHYTGTTYEKAVPTSRMLKEAEQIAKKVEARRKKREEETRNEHVREYIKSSIGDKMAVGICSDEDLPEAVDNIWIFPINDRLGKTGYYALFNMERIHSESLSSKRVLLEVPKGQEGRFIGKGHYNEFDWADQLCVNEVKVVGI